jgi:FkbM family methyltransferase
MPAMAEIRRLLLSVPGKLAGAIPGKGLSRFPLVSLLNAIFVYNLNPKGLVLLDIQGSKMYVDTRDTGVAPYLLEWGYYEKSETELVRSIVKEGMIVVDVGANIGYYTLLAAQLVGKTGKVFAFEPDPYNHSLLSKNTKINGYSNVVTVQKAVYSNSKNVELHLDKRNLGGHSLSTANVHEDKSVTVPATSLDDFFEKAHLKISLVKIDVQGLETTVIEGMDRIVRENRDLQIILEFWPWGLQNAGSSALTLLNKLGEYGFMLYEIEPHLKSVSVEDLLSRCTGKKFTTLYCARSLH